MSPTKLKVSFFSVLSLILIAFIYFLIAHTSKDNLSKDEVLENVPSMSVILLNGCGIDRAALRFRNFLISKNINAKIYGQGNTKHCIYNKTIIAVKIKNKDKLRDLIKLTGIKRWFYAENKNSDVDFQIFIGNDFEQYLK